jgi:hypothetical protein
MKRVICWLRGHRWGSWFNRKTQQYHSVCCERCGMWFGDYKPAAGVAIPLEGRDA